MCLNSYNHTSCHPHPKFLTLQSIFAPLATLFSFLYCFKYNVKIFITFPTRRATVSSLIYASLNWRIFFSLRMGDGNFSWMLVSCLLPWEKRFVQCVQCFSNGNWTEQKKKEKALKVFALCGKTERYNFF